MYACLFVGNIIIRGNSNTTLLNLVFFFITEFNSYTTAISIFHSLIQSLTSEIESKVVGWLVLDDEKS